MEISQIGAAASQMASAQTGDAVANLVLKKALQSQGQGALQLIQSVPQQAPRPSSGPLGGKVDTYA